MKKIEILKEKNPFHLICFLCRSTIEIIINDVERTTAKETKSPIKEPFSVVVFVGKGL